MLVNNEVLTLNEGASGTIADTVLQVTDTDNIAEEITYTVINLTDNGSLVLSGTALTFESTFTQEEINNGLLTYVHDGSETTSDSFSFNVTDGAGNTIDSTIFNITVNPVNDAPTLENALGDQTATEGESFNFTIPANTFADVDDASLSYALADGTILPSGLTFDPTTATFSGTPTDTASGIYDITVTATDASTASISDTFTLTVLNPVNIVNGTSDSETLPGTDGDDIFDAGAGNDTVNGGNGNDIIDGGRGSDRLKGGPGDDTYILDSRRDVVIEAPGEGTDTVQSSANHTLIANVENLILTGTANTRGTGNDLDNSIKGNSGNNSLKGLGGNDTLVGGAGDDTLLGGAGDDLLEGGEGLDSFLFGSGSAFNSSAFGVDSISDFTKGEDKIALSKASFTALSSAVNTNLLESEFATINVTAAEEVLVAGVSSASIVYNQGTGNIVYNQNGESSGLGSGEIFATLTGTTTPTLDANDFFVQA